MTPEQAKTVKIHDVLQVVKHNEGSKIGHFIMVIEMNSAQVTGLLKTDGAPQPVRLPWSHVEATGGVAIIDSSGNVLKKPEPVAKHHP